MKRNLEDKVSDTHVYTHTHRERERERTRAYAQMRESVRTSTHERT